MASNSGGPPMAAPALPGEPLTMKAMPGPEPIPMSIEFAVIACCNLASPANALASTSTPFFAKKPLRLPIFTSVLRQKRFGVKLAHVRLGGKRFHLDEGAAQHLERRRIEMAVIGEHRHQ